jgi:hypothetical protein
VNDSTNRIETLDPRTKPAVFDAGLNETVVSRLCLHAGCEFLREGYFTVGPNEPNSKARSLLIHAAVFSQSGQTSQIRSRASGPE